MPDKHAGDWEGKHHVPAATVAGKSKVERNEAVRVRRAADNFRQAAWFGRDADGAKAGRGGTNAGDAGVQVEQRMTAPRMTIRARIARLFDWRFESLFDQILPKVQPLKDEVAASEFLPGFQQVKTEVDGRALEVRRGQQLRKAAPGLVAGQCLGEQREALAMFAELGVRQVIQIGRASCRERV